MGVLVVGRLGSVVLLGTSDIVELGTLLDVGGGLRSQQGNERGDRNLMGKEVKAVQEAEKLKKWEGCELRDGTRSREPAKFQAV